MAEALGILAIAMVGSALVEHFYLSARLRREGGEAQAEQ